MGHKLSKTLAIAGVSALLLSACQSGDDGGSDSGGDDSGGGGEDPVFAEMTSWDACEVLDGIEPIIDYMDIKGFGSSTSEGGEPNSHEYGNTWDPASLRCTDLIYLGSLETDSGDLSISGEIKVAIVPTESDADAEAMYAERLSVVEGNASQGEDAQSTELGDPWDEGVAHSWMEDSDNPNHGIIARDGQWIFHVDLNHSQDWGATTGGYDPVLAYTPEELTEWFAETYFPEVNQSLNDQIAEVQ